MNRRLLIAAGLALAAVLPAQGQTALDDIVARKQVTIAIPTDFPPCGFVGVDLKPQGRNAEREKVIDFTAACSPFFQAVFAARSLPLKSFADLGGNTVGGTRGAIEDMMNFARMVADRVVFMHAGRIHELGPPAELLGAPKTPELQQFLSALH